MTFDYYFKVLISLSLIAGVLYVFYLLSQRYRKTLFTGDLKISDRVSIDKGVSAVVVVLYNVDEMQGLGTPEDLNNFLRKLK